MGFDWDWLQWILFFVGGFIAIMIEQAKNKNQD